LGGVGLLMTPGELLGGSGVDLVGAVVLVAASLSWALGSVLSPRVGLPASPLTSTAIQMLGGGALLFVAGLLAGEPRRLVWSAVSLESLLALGYLIVFGALLAFTVYVWLLEVADTAKVATYAYVNPVVAILLGWAFAGEELSGRTLAAAFLILASVALIVSFRGRTGRPGSKPARVEVPGGADVRQANGDAGGQEDLLEEEERRQPRP
jgi:drug/metabolite transporter (DMT)-like permease